MLERGGGGLFQNGSGDKWAGAEDVWGESNGTEEDPRKKAMLLGSCRQRFAGG